MSPQAWVFVAYFAVVFAIGWLSMLRTRDEADYWIAGGKLGWFTGGATLAATHVSAGTFVGTVGIIYTAGWSFGWVLLSIPLAYWFVAAVLAPRFTRVRQLTLPAFMEARYYSKGVRGIAAGVALVATVVYIQAQIVAGGLVANIVFGVPEAWGMVAFTAILLAYTVIGGMIAVVWTDTFQLVIMVLGAVLALPLAVRQVGGPAQVLHLVESARPTVFHFGNLPTSLLFAMGMAFFLGSIATPEKLTRLYSMKDLPTIRRGVFFATVCITGLNLMVFLIGLCAVVLFPALPNGDMAMPMVATAVLTPLLGALLLAAITSAMMSTVSSLLIVAGSALSVDLYQNLVAPDAPASRRRWVDRLGILVVGTIPVLLLLSGVGKGKLVQLIVLLFTALMASSFAVPVVGGVFWRRATREGAAAGMVGGIAAAFLWQALGPESIHAVVPGFLTSLLLWWGVSLLTPPPPPEAVAPYFPSVRPDPGDPS